jgi:hypothetical protein
MILRRPDQHVALLSVLLLVMIGMGVVLMGQLRIGIGVMSCAVWLAAGLRALAPTSVIGLLAVRSRRLDVLTLVPLALGLSVLAFVVPVPD